MYLFAEHTAKIVQKIVRGLKVNDRENRNALQSTSGR